MTKYDKKAAWETVEVVYWRGNARNTKITGNELDYFRKDKHDIISSHCENS